MRPTPLRRTAVAASAAVTLALVLTACGGDDKPREDSGKADASASAAAKPDVRALPAVALDRLAVGPADLRGYRVTKVEGADVVNVGDVSSDQPACGPLAEALAGAAPGTPAATAHRRAEKGGARTDVALGSYDGEGAQRAFEALKAAGTACAQGFRLTSTVRTEDITKLVPKPVTAGDEALGWTVTGKKSGAGALVVFRKGNSLVAVTADALPTAVADAQAAKLR
ncbi:hypothetical protein ACIRSU_23810 [Streptomyces sp. NPDC101160]|uniref:hypothetical protein n=1 Tax=Streptomyces sp. NPDC101160 TaxID=3366118 RepID=UPI003814224D